MDAYNHICTDLCARACDTCGAPLCLDATDFDDPGLAHPGGEAAEAALNEGFYCTDCTAHYETAQSAEENKK